MVEIIQRPKPIIAGLSVVFLSVMAVSGCDEQKPKKQHTLLEIIRVQASCFEDHVRLADTYAGQIVRWKSITSGEVTIYGYVNNTKDPVQRALALLEKPNSYQTPSVVEFQIVEADTNQASWSQPGISNFGEGKLRYASTCQIEVMGREAGPSTASSNRSTKM